MSAREIRVAAASLAIGTIAAIAGCSAAQEDPFVEYPEPSGVANDAAGGTDGAIARDAGGPEASGPISGKQLLAEPVFVEGVTSDGNLVLDVAKAVKVLTPGTPALVTVVTDYDPGYDSLLVRGRFVAAWLGDVPGTRPLTLWAKTGGVQTVAALTYADAFYPKSAADDFAYAAPGGDVLHRDVWATRAGAGAGARVVADLDTGLTNAQCRATIAWAPAELLVAGCPNGVTTASVALYALDGSGPTRTVLAGSAPGLWTNRARTRVLVQTTTASSLHALEGVATPVPLDGPVRQAFFSSDDSKVVYRHAAGNVKRAATTAPASPLELLPAALSILAVSPDARFTVVATTGDPASSDSDVVVSDAMTPGTGRTLAAQKAAFIGLSRTGTHAVWLGDRGLSVEGKLYVASLPDGAPQKLSELAERVTLDGDVVYWQEFDLAAKSNVLKAARVTAPGTVIPIDKGLDTLTARTVVIGKSLFVASKVGLWEYAALSQ